MENINANLNKDTFTSLNAKDAEHDQVTKLSEQQGSTPKITKLIDKQAEDKGVEQSLLSSVDKLETLAQLNSKQFKFHIDEQTKSSVVVVTDKETNEVIRQIPSEEVLELASKIDELQEQIFGQPLGVLFDQKI
ncbi:MULTISPECIES: flagellar protein FlaG [unclassified Pseudoalteromonas]|uniref:flagellar protein FlaG n=1 Tax=unclassified Pseudoalteromonas TaxID=194690 RepID=UPI003015651F